MSTEQQKRYFRERYAEKRDEILAKDKSRRENWTTEEHERRIQYNRDWYAKNREKQLAKYAEKQANLTQEQRERKQQQRKDYYERNREHICAKVRAYNARKPEIKRAWHLREYGIEQADYDRLLREQNSLCAICGIAATDARNGLHIDHDHDTGAIRGLLCESCNMGLGKFYDNTERLLAAAVYLDERKKVADLVRPK